MNKSKEIALVGIFSALAIVVGYLERLLPPPVPAVPGIKLGIANIVILTVLYFKDFKTAFKINLVRILISGLLFGSLSGIIYSLSGGLVSLSVMAVFKKTNFFGIIGISVLGGVFHNVAQLFAASIIIENVKLFLYTPAIVLSGTITGIFVGAVSYVCLKHLPQIIES